MTDARILNLKALAHAADGTVIPAANRAAFEQLDVLLGAANEVFAEAQVDATELRELARTEGYAQGLAQARSEMATELASAQRKGHDLYEKQTAMVQDLALAIVERLAPGLDAAALLQPMVSRSILAAQASQYLQVKVHPAQVEVAKAAIDELGNVHPAISAYKVIPDDTVDERACVVETEVGAVRSSLDQQLAAIRAALSAPLETSEDNELG